MFVKIGKDKHINLEQVLLMVEVDKIIIFFSNQSYLFNAKNYNAKQKLFEIKSDPFPSKDEAKIWLHKFVEASWSNQFENQPDCWD